MKTNFHKNENGNRRTSDQIKKKKTKLYQNENKKSNQNVLEHYPNLYQTNEFLFEPILIMRQCQTLRILVQSALSNSNLKILQSCLNVCCCCCFVFVRVYVWLLYSCVDYIKWCKMSIITFV